ncbi:DUF1430 domain-containing protein [Desmospora profundinema]|uniref:Bacteriocin-associated integral membrane protein n=1 Tax=Desmospora profundinema TaxID=1571184 RepID=A0ABU1IPJ6_9BACL|nr:DUF1430 domain-containing protein [Desmospora profundinema]MDR6226658.1 bacteriocin-associated integral membrane protein [Desmospora profundinema]
MKKIVFIALLISFAFSLSIAYQQIKNNEIEKLATLEKGVATPFMIPEHKGLADPEEVYPLLLKAAKEAEVNLFRGGRYYRPDEQIEMIKYLLLTGETRFFDHIELASGRTLQPKETQDSRQYLSSIQTKNKNQVGRIYYFDPQQLVTVQPLQASYDYLPVDGRYFAETKDDTQLQLFLKALSDEINTYLRKQDGEKAHSYTPADFQPPEAFTEPREGFFALTSLSGLRYQQYILFLVTLLLLIYYIFNTAKRVGILKMHGVSNLHLWWMTAGRFITVAVVVAVLGSVLFALGLYKPTTFVYQSLIQLGQAYLILTILSLFCYGYLSTIKVSQILKNRKDTRSIFVLNMVLKVICAAVLIFIGLETFQQIADLRAQQERIHAQEGQLDHWDQMEDYGLLKAYRGHTTAYTVQELAAEDFRVDKALNKLYPYVNALGSLYIDAGEYEEETLLLNQNYSGILSIMVNANYLKAFPVYDKKGNPVQLTEETTDWVVLVPEQYRDREEEIRDFFERDKEIRNFYLTVDEGQKIKIIWLAQNQYIFSFNPDVFPTEQNKIGDPIIHVKTEENQLFTFRSGTKGGGLTDPLKLKLIDGDPALTYEKLKPELKRLKLDNLIDIQSFHQYVLQEMDFLYREIRTAQLTMLGIIGVFLFLIVQNLLIFFHRHQKRLVVNRLFGIGYFRTYRSVFIWWTVTSIAFVVLSYVADQAEDPRFQLISGITDPHFWILVASLLGIEILATVIALTIMERRNKIQVIKGGD